MYLARRAALLGAALVGLVAVSQTLAGCGKNKHSGSAGSPGGNGGEAGSTSAGNTRVLQDYALGSSFFAAPFPDDARLDTNGHPLLDGFPNPSGSNWLADVRCPTSWPV